MKQKTVSILFLLSAMLLGGCGTIENPTTSLDPTTSSAAPTTSTPTPSTSTTPESSSSSSDEKQIITIAEALEIAKDYTNGASTERYYIHGTITAISNFVYGAMDIQDETGTINAYGTYGADGEKRYGDLDDKPVVGDEVTLYANLQNYNGTLEIKSGWIVDIIHHEQPFDPSEYTEMSIRDVREKEKGTKALVEGVVARITYANGKVPTGFFLIDNTSSIHVYDASVAALVKEGNKISLAGTKDYWILDTEINNAQKFGYQGACQLTSATIISNDKGNHDFDTSWIEEKTVKEVMELPITENITSLIYKVNAYVKKAQGTGFINYYINDLDGKTGSYVYTQCNGSDFAWMDEFDGKICTVYMSALNAKSTASGCNWRFVPVKIMDENYTFDTTKVGEYVFTYHIEGLWQETYTGDPVLEVPTTISSEILKFENAQISYESSNTNVAYFEESESKMFFHTKDNGEADITVSIAYGNNPIYQKQIHVKVETPVVGESITVKEAIDSEVGTTVTVKGIAGPSLVNKVGFYLIDESGAIAITTSADTLANIELGNEVILEGTRSVMGNDDATGIKGQICILDCELKGNLYGKHEYSTASFDSSKTLADLKAIPVTEVASAQVYVVDATFKKVENKNYSNFYVVSGETEILLYSASGNQYNWLSQYVGVTVSVELALCNWNKKKDNYRGCVLSVTDAEGVKTCNTLNYK